MLNPVYAASTRSMTKAELAKAAQKPPLPFERFNVKTLLTILVKMGVPPPPGNKRNTILELVRVNATTFQLDWVPKVELAKLSSQDLRAFLAYCDCNAADRVKALQGLSRPSPPPSPRGRPLPVAPNATLSPPPPGRPPPSPPSQSPPDALPRMAIDSLSTGVLQSMLQSAYGQGVRMPRTKEATLAMVRALPPSSAVWARFNALPPLPPPSPGRPLPVPPTPTHGSPGPSPPPPGRPPPPPSLSNPTAELAAKAAQLPFQTFTKTELRTLLLRMDVPLPRAPHLDRDTAFKLVKLHATQAALSTLSEGTLLKILGSDRAKATRPAPGFHAGHPTPWAEGDEEDEDEEGKEGDEPPPPSLSNPTAELAAKAAQLPFETFTKTELRTLLLRMGVPLPRAPHLDRDTAFKLVKLQATEAALSTLSEGTLLKILGSDRAKATRPAPGFHAGHPTPWAKGDEEDEDEEGEEGDEHDPGDDHEAGGEDPPDVALATETTIADLQRTLLAWEGTVTTLRATLAGLIAAVPKNTLEVPATPEPEWRQTALGVTRTAISLLQHSLFDWETVVATLRTSIDDLITELTRSNQVSGPAPP